MSTDSSPKSVLRVEDQAAEAVGGHASGEVEREGAGDVSAVTSTTISVTYAYFEPLTPPAVRFGLGMFPLIYDKAAENRNGALALVVCDASPNAVNCIWKQQA